MRLTYPRFSTFYKPFGLCVLLHLSGMVNGQDYFDSLRTIWQNEKIPSETRLSALYDYGWDGYLYSNPDSAIYFANIQEKLAIESGNENFQGKAYNLLGMAFYIKGEMDTAIFFHEKNMAIRKELGDDYGIATALNNIGIIYRAQTKFDEALACYEEAIELQKKVNDFMGIGLSLLNLGEINKLKGNIPKATEHYTLALKIGERIESMDVIIPALNNIGVLHSDQNEFELALTYYERALELCKSINSIFGMGQEYLNIGATHSGLKNYEKAIEYDILALELFEQIDDKRGMALAHNNLGNNLKSRNNDESAFGHFEKAADLYSLVGDTEGIVNAKIHIAEYYYDYGQFDKAREIGEATIRICDEFNLIEEKASTAQILHKIYFKLGRFDEAYATHKLYVSIRDSVNNKTNLRQLLEQQYEYEYAKQSAQDSIKNAEIQKVNKAQLEAQRSETKRKTQQSYFLVAGLILCGIFLALVFNRFNITRKQKAIIEVQKKRVDQAFGHLEEKNKEILDSINYAKKIQTAILPPDSYFSKNLPDSFVLYLPKDVVAGDFYWMESFASPSNSFDGEGTEATDSEGKDLGENLIILAVADCTGHGVPGAMVSVVCHNALNRSVKEFGLTQTNEILDKTRELVLETFSRSEDNVNDGMDIALCSINKKTNLLHFSGANNGLILLRDKELIEFKPDKQPIGKFINTKPFTRQEIPIQKGDQFYLFSDGYADQFGGDPGKAGGKKFKYSRLKSLLTDIQLEPVALQKEILETSLNKWRGDIEQVDDVCIIGFRF